MRSLLVPTVTAFAMVLSLASSVTLAPAPAWATEDMQDTKTDPIIEPPVFAKPTFTELEQSKIHSAPVTNTDLKAQLTRAAPGWLRSYATSALPPDLRVAIPDYYESVLETDMRISINEALAMNGIEVVEDRADAPFRLRYSAEVKTPETSLRRSAYRIAPDADYSYNQGVRDRSEQNNSFRPALSLGQADVTKARGPYLRVSILVLEGDERIWSGFAEADLGEFRRSELVAILANALMQYWGENAEIEHAQFSHGHVSARPFLTQAGVE